MLVHGELHALQSVQYGLLSFFIGSICRDQTSQLGLAVHWVELRFRGSVVRGESDARLAAIALLAALQADYGTAIVTRLAHSD